VDVIASVVFWLVEFSAVVLILSKQSGRITATSPPSRSFMAAVMGRPASAGDGHPCFCFGAGRNKCRERKRRVPITATNSAACS
jgi:hypothetical protein